MIVVELNRYPSVVVREGIKYFWSYGTVHLGLPKKVQTFTDSIGKLSELEKLISEQTLSRHYSHEVNLSYFVNPNNNTVSIDLYSELSHVEKEAFRILKSKGVRRPLALTLEQAGLFIEQKIITEDVLAAAKSAKVGPAQFIPNYENRLKEKFLSLGFKVQ